MPSVPLRVTLDRRSNVPMYRQLADQLSQAISSGRLKPGDAVENELSLAARLGLSRPTVRRAITELANQGLVVRRRGVGTKVARQVVQSGDTVTSLHDDLTAVGRGITTRILALDMGVVYPTAATALGLEPQTPLVFVQRLRLADGDPLAILTNWLPPAYADVSRAELLSAGLYALLRSRGDDPVQGRQIIRARPPTGEQRRLLKMTRADAVLQLTRWTSDEQGRPVEYGEHCYRGDQYAFEVEFRPQALLGR